jgi:hypothetical protein
MIIHWNGTVLHKINANTVLEIANKESESSSTFLDKVTYRSGDEPKINHIDDVYMGFLNKPLQNMK